ncbi:hypothetical protein RJ639_041818 [Escallonia herrerae]|uniref:Uncharacterized protein n=1 Tax=Escallonia herrerae TaxID=1293975 RepID=A0AA89BBC7_9ASTE|nr:hypothetical protein RJ639_041818 [Escallonia herrerae]
MGDVLWNLEYALQLQEASSQLNFHEDTVMEQPNKLKTKGDPNIVVSDDSGVVVGSPLFLKVGDFQGRLKQNLNVKLGTLVHLERQFSVHNNCDPVVVTAVALPSLRKSLLRPLFHNKLRP